MRSRVRMTSLAAAMALVVLLVAFGSSLRAHTALGGDPYTLTKAADATDVVAGNQIGFTIELTVQDSADIVWYIEDTFAARPGTSWSVESFSGDAVSCTIKSHGPDQLECVSDQDTGLLHIKVHVVSPTTIDSVGDYQNEAAAGYPGFDDIFASATIHVTAPPTFTPSPTPSPTPTETNPPPPGLINWGAIDNFGHNAVLELASSGSAHFYGYDVPEGGSCAATAGDGGGTVAVDVADISISNGQFDKTDGTTHIVGTIDDTSPGDLEADVTVDEGTACEATDHFSGEPAARALMIGDVDCSWTDFFGGTSPQGPTPAPTTPPNPNKGITVKDAIAVLKWVAGFEEDSPPLDCPLIAAAFPTPVPGSATPTVIPTSTPRPTHFQGDVDCSGQVSDKDVLEILQFMAALDQPSCGALRSGSSGCWTGDTGEHQFRNPGASVGSKPKNCQTNFGRPLTYPANAGTFTGHRSFQGRACS